MTTLAAPSEAFWTAVGAVAGLMAALFAAWGVFVAWRAAVPKRKLTWSYETTPLLMSTYSGLQVTLSGTPLSHPNTLRLTIHNQGNRDLSAEHFSGQPIEFRTDANIVSILRKSSAPSSRRVPEAEIHGNALHVLPSVLHRKQSITYLLLVDGVDPEVAEFRESLSHSTLTERKDTSNSFGGSASFRPVVTGITLIATVGALLFTGLSTYYSAKVAHDNLEQAREDSERWGRLEQDVYECVMRRLREEQKESATAGTESSSSDRCGPTSK